MVPFLNMWHLHGLLLMGFLPLPLFAMENHLMSVPAPRSPDSDDSMGVVDREKSGVVYEKTENIQFGTAPVSQLSQPSPFEDNSRKAVETVEQLLGKKTVQPAARAAMVAAEMARKAKLTAEGAANLTATREMEVEEAAAAARPPLWCTYGRSSSREAAKSARVDLPARPQAAVASSRPRRTDSPPSSFLAVASSSSRRSEDKAAPASGIERTSQFHEFEALLCRRLKELKIEMEAQLQGLVKAGLAEKVSLAEHAYYAKQQATLIDEQMEKIDEQMEKVREDIAMHAKKVDETLEKQKDEIYHQLRKQFMEDTNAMRDVFSRELSEKLEKQKDEIYHQLRKQFSDQIQKLQQEISSGKSKKAHIGKKIASGKSAARQTGTKQKQRGAEGSGAKKASSKASGSRGKAPLKKITKKTTKKSAKSL